MTEAAGTPTGATRLWLVRHGETEWARLGRHTSHTDIPLTRHGQAQARTIGRRLAGRTFDYVATSPLQRAVDTARLAGFGDAAVVDADLHEWDYGDLEGLLTSEIRERWPGWTIWTGPWPNGETADQVGARADRVIARCLAEAPTGDALLVSHGHFLRVVAARWLGQSPASGGWFALGTATISVLGWEHEARVVTSWNAPCPP